jgi:Flp pilus assembly pilin Flp
MFLRAKKGQSTLEYAIIIAVVVAALLAMQIYVKRGVQGKLRSSTDEIGEQYSPGLTTGSYTTTTGSTSTEIVTPGGATTTGITRGSQDRTGGETVAPLDQEPRPR